MRLLQYALWLAEDATQKDMALCAVLAQNTRAT